MENKNTFKTLGFRLERTEKVATPNVTSQLKINLKKGDSLQVFIDKMNAEPSQENLTKARNKGLDFVEIVNNKWQKINVFKDDFENFHYILIYTKFTFNPYAIGRYKKS